MPGIYLALHSDDQRKSRLIRKKSVPPSNVAPEEIKNQAGVTSKIFDSIKSIKFGFCTAKAKYERFEPREKIDSERKVDDAATASFKTLAARREKSWS